MFKTAFGKYAENHPFTRSSNLRVLGFASHLASNYADNSFTNSIIQDLSKISSEQNFYETNKSFEYDPNKLINETLKANYMLDVVEGPNLDNLSYNDLTRVPSPEISDIIDSKNGLYPNATDQLFATVRQYFYAETLNKYWISQNTEELEKKFYVDEKLPISDDYKKSDNLNKEFVEYIDVRLRKELKTLQRLPLETEIKIKFTSGKGKFDKLRKADRIVEIAIQDKEKSVLVSLGRLIGLPVYSELAKNS